MDKYYEEFCERFDKIKKECERMQEQKESFENKYNNFVNNLMNNNYQVLLIKEKSEYGYSVEWYYIHNIYAKHNIDINDDGTIYLGDKFITTKDKIFRNLVEFIFIENNRYIYETLLEKYKGLNKNG